MKQCVEFSYAHFRDLHQRARIQLREVTRSWCAHRDFRPVARSLTYLHGRRWASDRNPLTVTGVPHSNWVSSYGVASNGRGRFVRRWTSETLYTGRHLGDWPRTVDDGERELRRGNTGDAVTVLARCITGC